MTQKLPIAYAAASVLLGSLVTAVVSLKRHLLAEVAALDKMHLHGNNVTDIIGADVVAGRVSPTNF